MENEQKEWNPKCIASFDVGEIYIAVSIFQREEILLENGSPKKKVNKYLTDSGDVFTSTENCYTPWKLLQLGIQPFVQIDEQRNSDVHEKNQQHVRTKKGRRKNNNNKPYFANKQDEEAKRLSTTSTSMEDNQETHHKKKFNHRVRNISKEERIQSLSRTVANMIKTYELDAIFIEDQISTMEHNVLVQHVIQACCVSSSVIQDRPIVFRSIGSNAKFEGFVDNRTRMCLLYSRNKHDAMSKKQKMISTDMASFFINDCCHKYCVENQLLPTSLVNGLKKNQQQQQQQSAATASNQKYSNSFIDINKLINNKNRQTSSVTRQLDDIEETPTQLVQHFHELHADDNDDNKFFVPNEIHDFFNNCLIKSRSSLPYSVKPSSLKKLMTTQQQHDDNNHGEQQQQENRNKEGCNRKKNKKKKKESSTAITTPHERQEQKQDKDEEQESYKKIICNYFERLMNRDLENFDWRSIHKWQTTFNSLEKKDDLADAFLQGIYGINMLTVELENHRKIQRDYERQKVIKNPPVITKDSVATTTNEKNSILNYAFNEKKIIPPPIPKKEEKHQ